MTRNIGSIDRIFRIVIGLGLIAMVFVGPQTPWGWLGAILIVTAFINFCPVYRLLGISSFSRALRG